MYLRDSDGNLYIRDTYGIPIPLDSEEGLRATSMGLIPADTLPARRGSHDYPDVSKRRARISATPFSLVASATNSSSDRRSSLGFSNDLVPAALDPGEPELPEGWEKVLHEGSSDIFYCNKELMISQRTHPAAIDPMKGRKYGW